MDVGVGIGMVALAFAGVVIAYVGILGFAGKLPRNRFAGIRTSATMASDEAWRTAHTAGGPALVFGGVAVFSIALAFAPFAFAGKLGETAQVAIVMATVGILVGSAVASLLAANRALKAKQPAA